MLFAKPGRSNTPSSFSVFHQTLAAETAPVCYSKSMAELNYGDVQRAVQDATRNLRELMSRIISRADRLSGIEHQLGVVRGELEDVRGQLGVLSHNVSSIRPLAQPLPHGDSGHLAKIPQLCHEVAVLDQRLAMIERYLAVICEYLYGTQKPPGERSGD